MRFLPLQLRNVRSLEGKSKREEQLERLCTRVLDLQRELRREHNSKLILHCALERVRDNEKLLALRWVDYYSQRFELSMLRLEKSKLQAQLATYRDSIRIMRWLGCEFSTALAYLKASAQQKGE